MQDLTLLCYNTGDPQPGTVEEKEGKYAFERGEHRVKIPVLGDGTFSSAASCMGPFGAMMQRAGVLTT